MTQYARAVRAGGRWASLTKRVHGLERRGASVTADAAVAFLALGFASGFAATLVTTLAPAVSAARGPALLMLAAHATLVALFGRAYARVPRPDRLPRAHAVTLARFALALGVAQLTFAASATAPILTAAAALAGLALALDGVDGWLARRDGTAGPFGAWFDQEVDALLILVLALAVWTTGAAGPWVLLAGGWRYLFLAARSALPRLRGDLAPSMRRRIVCVVQVATLVAGLAPFVPAALRTALLASGVVLLTWSFAIDIAALWRTSGAAQSPSSQPTR